MSVRRPSPTPTAAFEPQRLRLTLPNLALLQRSHDALPTEANKRSAAESASTDGPPSEDGERFPAAGDETTTKRSRADEADVKMDEGGSREVREKARKGVRKAVRAARTAVEENAQPFNAEAFLNWVHPPPHSAALRELAAKQDRMPCSHNNIREYVKEATAAVDALWKAHDELMRIVDREIATVRAMLPEQDENGVTGYVAYSVLNRELDRRDLKHVNASDFAFYQYLQKLKSALVVWYSEPVLVARELTQLAKGFETVSRMFNIQQLFEDSPKGRQILANPPSIPVGTLQLFDPKTGTVAPVPVAETPRHPVLVVLDKLREFEGALLQWLVLQSCEEKMQQAARDELKNTFYDLDDDDAIGVKVFYNDSHFGNWQFGEKIGTEAARRVIQLWKDASLLLPENDSLLESNADNVAELEEKIDRRETEKQARYKALDDEIQAYFRGTKSADVEPPTYRFLLDWRAGRRLKAGSEFDVKYEALVRHRNVVIPALETAPQAAEVIAAAVAAAAAAKPLAVAQSLYAASYPATAVNAVLLDALDPDAAIAAALNPDAAAGLNEVTAEAAAKIYAALPAALTAAAAAAAAAAEAAFRVIKRYSHSDLTKLNKIATVDGLGLDDNPEFGERLAALDYWIKHMLAQEAEDEERKLLWKAIQSPEQTTVRQVKGKIGRVKKASLKRPEDDQLLAFAKAKMRAVGLHDDSAFLRNKLQIEEIDPDDPIKAEKEAARAETIAAKLRTMPSEERQAVYEAVVRLSADAMRNTERVVFHNGFLDAVAPALSADAARRVHTTIENGDEVDIAEAKRYLVDPKIIELAEAHNQELTQLGSVTMKAYRYLYQARNVTSSIPAAGVFRGAIDHWEPGTPEAQKKAVFQDWLNAFVKASTQAAAFSAELAERSQAFATVDDEMRDAPPPVAPMEAASLAVDHGGVNNVRDFSVEAFWFSTWCEKWTAMNQATTVEQIRVTVQSFEEYTLYIASRQIALDRLRAATSINPNEQVAMELGNLQFMMSVLLSNREDALRQQLKSIEAFDKEVKEAEKKLQIDMAKRAEAKKKEAAAAGAAVADDGSDTASVTGPDEDALLENRRKSLDTRKLVRDQRVKFKSTVKGELLHIKAEKKDAEDAVSDSDMAEQVKALQEQIRKMQEAEALSQLQTPMEDGRGDGGDAPMQDDPMDDDGADEEAQEKNKNKRDKEMQLRHLQLMMASREARRVNAERARIEKEQRENVKRRMESSFIASASAFTTYDTLKAMRQKVFDEATPGLQALQEGQMSVGDVLIDTEFTQDQYAHLFVDDDSPDRAEMWKYFLSHGSTGSVPPSAITEVPPYFFNKPYAKKLLVEHLQGLRVFDDKTKDRKGAQFVKLASCIGSVDTDDEIATVADHVLPFFESMLRYRNTMIAVKLLLIRDDDRKRLTTAKARGEPTKARHASLRDANTELMKQTASIPVAFCVEARRLLAMSQGRFPDALAPSQPAFLPLRIWAPPRVGKSATSLFAASLAKRMNMLTMYACAPNKKIPIKEWMDKIEAIGWKPTSGTRAAQEGSGPSIVNYVAVEADSLFAAKDRVPGAEKMTNKDMIVYSHDDPNDVVHAARVLGTLKMSSKVVFHLRDEAQFLAKHDEDPATKMQNYDAPPPRELLYLRHYFGNEYGLNCLVSATLMPTLGEEKLWGFFGSMDQNLAVGMSAAEDKAVIDKRIGASFLPKLVPALRANIPDWYIGADEFETFVHRGQELYLQAETSMLAAAVKNESLDLKDLPDPVGSITSLENDDFGNKVSTLKQRHDVDAACAHFEAWLKFSQDYQFGTSAPTPAMGEKGARARRGGGGGASAHRAPPRHRAPRRRRRRTLSCRADPQRRRQLRAADRRLHRADVRRCTQPRNPVDGRGVVGEYVCSPGGAALPLGEDPAAAAQRQSTAGRRSGIRQLGTRDRARLWRHLRAVHGRAGRRRPEYEDVSPRTQPQRHPGKQ